MLITPHVRPRSKNRPTATVRLDILRQAARFLALIENELDPNLPSDERTRRRLELALRRAVEQAELELAVAAALQARRNPPTGAPAAADMTATVELPAITMSELVRAGGAS